MLHSHSLANSWCHIFVISSTEQIFFPSLCSVQFRSCINLNCLQNSLPRHLTATLIRSTEVQHEAKLNRLTLWPGWRMSERGHDRATEEDNQQVVMEDNWKQRDWKKSKNPEAHKEDMDAIKGLLTVPCTVIIQGDNKHCSLLLCQETSARTYTDLLGCIMKDRGASSLSLVLPLGQNQFLQMCFRI